jgi:AcrR family transcriptional regulator
MAAKARGTRERILDATWSLLASRKDASIGQIARVSRVSRQAVYLHFPNRAALLAETARRHDIESGFVARVEATRQLDPVDGLNALVREWFAYIPQIEVVASELLALVEGGEDRSGAFANRMADLREATAVAVHRIAKAGLLASGWREAEVTAWVWSRIHLTTWRHLVNECGWRPEAVLKRTLTSIASDVLRGQ